MMKQINGVNVDQLFGTINAIQETPSLAKFNFRASNKWMNGGHNRTTIKDFYGAGQEDTSRQTAFVLDNDEPAVLLGTDKGANPTEFVLHALAGCMTTSLVYHAANRDELFPRKPLPKDTIPAPAPSASPAPRKK